MPRYDFECPDGHVTEKIMKISDSGIKYVTCKVCRKLAKKVIGGVANVKDFEPYWDENLSPGWGPVYVKSRRHKAELLRKQGLVEQGMSESNRRIKRQIALERARDMRAKRMKERNHGR